MASLLPKLFPSASYCCKSSGLLTLSQQVKSASALPLNLLAKPFTTTRPVEHGHMKVYGRPKGPIKFTRYNEKVYPPQAPDEKPRPAYVCHVLENVKYSELKLWYVACLVRGMAIDEALRQLDYVQTKGGSIVKATLLEAQELAVKHHNVEYRNNLWIAESFAGKGVVVKGLRRHARKRFGIIHYRHSHYFVRLEEGPPPKHFYPPDKDGPTLLQQWIQERREEQVYKSL